MKKWILGLLSLPGLVLASSFQIETMSLKEKVGQLFMLPYSPSLQAELDEPFMQVMQNYHIGGVLIKQGSLRQVADYNYKLQQAVPTPVLISADAEWGLGMRVTNARVFPKAAQLGKLESSDLVHLVGQATGRDCKTVGVHWNFAPVMDITGNAINPAINQRAFSHDLNRVIAYSTLFAQGLESSGVMACGKHFPNHGAVIIDSHIGLPVLTKTLDELYKRDLLPFQAACQEGISSIMVAHILVPEIDPIRPASLSKHLVQGLLKEGWGYEGLIVTDALNMGALTNIDTPERIPLLALEAGCDVLLYGTHDVEELASILAVIPSAIDLIVTKAKEDKALIARIDESVVKILRYKERYIDPAWERPSDEALSKITSQD